MEVQATVVREVTVRDGPTFRSFYRDNVRSVIALGVALTGDRGAAEDLSQEAFTRAYRDWDRIAGYDDPGAWVRRVVANLAVSRWRRLGAERRALTRLVGRRDEQPGDLEPRDAELWAAVRRLPEPQAMALALHYVDDLPVAEIARVLDCAEGTAKSHLFRGRQRLAELLESKEVAR